jgi:hypothetical protein
MTRRERRQSKRDFLKMPKPKRDLIKAIELLGQPIATNNFGLIQSIENSINETEQKETHSAKTD